MKIRSLIARLPLLPLVFAGCTSAPQAGDHAAPASSPSNDPAAAAGASNASPGAGGSNDTIVGATTPSEACATPHRNFTVANRDYFRTFASTDAAKAAIAAVNGHSYLPPGNAYEARATAAIAKVFAAYQTLYPEAVAGMVTPPLALVEDIDAFNAASFPKLAWTDGEPTSAPWVFKYNRGFFVNGISDEQVLFITAHELGHLLLRNPNREYLTPIWYRAPASPFVFGEYMKEAPDVKSTGVRIIEAGARVGQMFAPELNGFGTMIGSSEFMEGITLTPRYNRYLAYLHATYARYTATPEICVSARDERAQITALVQTHYVQATTDGSLDLGSDAATLDALTKSFAGHESTCLSHLTMSFADVALEAAQSQSDEEIDPSSLALTQAEIDADVTDPTGNVVTKILTLAVREQDAMRAFVENPQIDYPRVRVFTMEDDADESAVRIFKILKIPVSQGMGGIFIASPKLKTACDAVSAGGKEPPYVGLVDPHHSHCWRNYRDLQLETALQSCPASWPQ